MTHLGDMRGQQKWDGGRWVWACATCGGWHNTGHLTCPDTPRLTLDDTCVCGHGSGDHLGGAGQCSGTVRYRAEAGSIRENCACPAFDSGPVPQPTSPQGDGHPGAMQDAPVLSEWQARETKARAAADEAATACMARMVDNDGAYMVVKHPEDYAHWIGRTYHDTYIRTLKGEE